MTDMNTTDAPTPAALAPAVPANSQAILDSSTADQQRENMAAMLRRCAHALEKRGREDLAADVVGLLRRYDLLGSPLRTATPQEAPAPLTDDARDAARYRFWRAAYTHADRGDPIPDALMALGDAWTPDEVDAAIDAAAGITAPTAPTGGKG